ncbi:YbaB/EbfC family nucleoid-associated protein [Actinoallomurus liliacearum]
MAVRLRLCRGFTGPSNVTGWIAMGEGPGSLDEFLNKSVADPPTSPDEIRARLAARAPRREDTPEPADAQKPESADGTRDDPRYADTDQSLLDTGERDAADGPSLTDVLAELAERAAQYAKLEERLAAERFAKKSPDGLLRLVVAGDGRPLSLDIDPSAVKGPDGHRLGDYIAALIMGARQQVATRRQRLEAALEQRAPVGGDTG